MLFVYSQLDSFGLTLSGSWCPKVSMGGFVAGGGTGPLTRYYGYAVDNVLGATLVTANGTVLYVDDTGRKTPTHNSGTVVNSSLLGENSLF